MNKKSVTKLAIVTIVLVVGILFLNVTENGDSSTTGDLFLPVLKSRANDLTKVSVSSRDGDVTIIRVEDEWTIEERDRFPADAATLRELVVELADAQAIEQKTANPDRYEQLGVEDGPEASGHLVTLAGDDFEYTVILGNEAQSNYRYARLQGEAQSWLIDVNPEVPETVSDWLVAEIIDIDAPEIRAVTINHSDGETIRVFKTSEEDTDFQVENVPEGRELTYPSVGNGIGGTLNDLRLDDVRRAEDASGDPVAVTSFETFDSRTVTVRTFDIGEEKWHAIEDKPAGSEEPVGDRPWLYRLPDYKRNLMVRRWEDILKEPETDEQE